MPRRVVKTFGLLDTVIVLLSSCALALFLFWLGAAVAGMSLLATLPEWLSKGFSGVWTWLTTGGAAAALGLRLRQRSGSKESLPNYWLAISGTTVGMVALVMGLGTWFGSAQKASSPTSPFLLKFRASLSEPKVVPALSFMEREPNWMDEAEMQGLAPLPNSDLYQVRISLPPPGKRFRAQARPLTESGYYAASVHPDPLELCFVRARRDPANGVAHYYARIDCRLGQGCGVNASDDPGWVTDCPRVSGRSIPALCCVPTVYAQAKPQAEAGWIIPALATLRNLGQTKGIGYTEFSVQSEPLKAIQGPGYFTYEIRVNGTLVSIDGWRSSDLRAALDPSKGVSLKFGLENLNFSGAEAGCEQIDLGITAFQGDKQVAAWRVFRKYAALRDAEALTVQAADGTRFQWSGKYVNPRAGDRNEVFVNSTRDLKYAEQVKARIDRARLTYDGQNVVGVLRPPLTSPNYGVIVGLRQPSGQVHFMFDSKGVQALTSWIESSRNSAAVRPVFPRPVMIYRIRGDDGEPQFKPCMTGGPGR